MPDSADPPPSQLPQEPSSASKPDLDMPPRRSHAGGRLRKPISSKFRAAAEQRLAHLRVHLRLHPLDPRPLAFSSTMSPHEAALRSLGLLDFARLDLRSGSTRPDLVARLIAYYDPLNHRSFVHGVRLSVGRTDFARALFLPPKPTTTAPPPDVDPPAVVSAILEFMKVYILPPFQDDDMCILPQEVGAAEQAVKEGSAHRVDWAGLIWGLVEKEIFEMPKRVDGVCYYGPYLQRLIWAQKPKLFELVDEEDRGEVALEVSVDVDVDEEDGDVDVMSKGLEEEESGDVISRGKSLEHLDSAEVDADVRCKTFDQSETEDVDSRSNNLEELEPGDMEARIKSIEEVELRDRDDSANGRNKRLETLELADEESSGTTLDESKTTDKLGLGFAAVEAAAVRSSNDDDLAEVAQAGDEYTLSVAVAEKDTCPLVATILVTCEQVLAVRGEGEEADGEEEKDTTGLSMGVSSDGEEEKDTTGLSMGVSSDGEEEKDTTGLSMGVSSDGEEEKDTTGLSLVIGSNGEEEKDTTRLSLGISSDGEEEKGTTGLNLGVSSDGEEEKDTSVLSLGVSSDGEEKKDTAELSLGISSDGEEERVATGLSLGMSTDGEEEKDTTGLSLGISSANDYDSMDVEENASVENLDEDDSGKEGADMSEDDAFEECRGGAEMNRRTEDEKGDEETTHCLQRCNSSAFAGMEFENLNKGDVGMRDEMSFDDGFPGKMGCLHGMESTNLLEAMNSIPAAYNGSENAHDLSSRDFLAMGADAHKDEIDLGTGSSFFFGNNGKRHIGDIDEYSDHMQAQGQFLPVNQHKRLRNDNNSSISPGSAVFNANFSEPIQNLLIKASMFYQQKERELQVTLVDKQNLANLLQEKETYIKLLNSARFEQESKWQAELRRFEHDLNVMGQLVSGYKKALKQNRATFDEYRRKFPCEKPRYVDVPGGGGLVLGVKELEIKRLEEEQQKLAVANDMIEKFQNEWFLTADEWMQQITLMWSRMEGLAREIDLLNEKRKAEVSTPATEE